MPWYLEVKTPDHAVAVYELDHGMIFNVGRDEGEVRIPQDPGISSVHVQLDVREREILWDDLNSTNGTYHRERRKTMGVVLPGDSLVVGKTVLKFDPQAKNLIKP